ncbi:hypothetical protein TNCV_933321 [Trichonephila clavipes]|nr:hypothetical protein TNCV_933321 [Trichonephila clavipes]
MGTPTTRNVVPAGSEYAETVRSNNCMLYEGDTRNRWRDGPVCPDVDQELWRLGPDSSGHETKTGKKPGEREERDRKKTQREKNKRKVRGRAERKDTRPREREREALLEWRKRAESGNWIEKDDERRWH